MRDTVQLAISQYLTVALPCSLVPSPALQWPVPKHRTWWSSRSWLLIGQQVMDRQAIDRKQNTTCVYFHTMHHLHHLLRQRLQKFHFHLQPFIFGLSFWDLKLSQETEKNAHLACEEDQHFEHKLKKISKRNLTKLWPKYSAHDLWVFGLHGFLLNFSSLAAAVLGDSSNGNLAGLSRNGAGDDREDNHYLGKLQVVNHSAWFSMVLRMILPCTGWWYMMMVQTRGIWQVPMFFPSRENSSEQCPLHIVRKHEEANHDLA